MTTRTLNIAMIGHGFMGRAHSNAFHQVGHFFDTPFTLKRKVICGRNQQAVSEMAARWGWDETANDWRAVVDRKDIDVVDIGTPNALHAEIAIAAAKAGKIIWCEKPLAMNGAQAAQMAQAAKGVPNLVWFNYRRVPAIALAKQLIDEGKIGQVYHYRAAYLQSWGADPARIGVWRFNKADAGSGAMGDLLTHIVDLAHFLNGPLSELNALVHTFAHGREVDDAAIFTGRFANGAIGTFEATRFAIGMKNRNRFEIHGSKGALAFNLEELNHLLYYNATLPADQQGWTDLMVTGPGHPYTANFWPSGHIIGYEHTFIATLADFLLALASGSEFHANFEDGVKVQQVMDAVEKSSETRSWVKL